MGKQTSAISLGVNTAAWDGNLLNSRVASLLQAAHLGLIRYPGGSWADGYNWQTNQHNGQTQSVDFAQFMHVIGTAQAQALITVNYGSGTPQQAAAWVRYANVTHHDHVRYWEIGNESYGAWEVDNHPDPHTATSYATYARAFMQQMKRVDPTIQIGVPTRIHTGDTWDPTVLKADGKWINYLSVHWYPFWQTTGFTPQQVLGSISQIPTMMQNFRRLIQHFDPKAYVMVTEMNISSGYPGSAYDEQPLSALFAADAALTWLSQGAKTVDWWDLHNYGSMQGDFGLLSSGSNQEPPAQTPFPPYYGLRLASMLTIPGSHLTQANSGVSGVSKFVARRQGTTTVMFVNEHLQTPRTVILHCKTPLSAMATYAYSAKDPRIVATDGSSAAVLHASTGSRGQRYVGLSLQPESVTVVRINRRSSGLPSQ